MNKDTTRDLLFRLMRKLPDESFEVVGYERAAVSENCKIGFNWEHSKDGKDWEFMYLATRILHDRKDQYIGIEVDGVKVFERDEGLLNGHHLGDSKVTVVYEAPSFQVQHADGALYELNEYFYKITGIKGVTP